MKQSITKTPKQDHSRHRHVAARRRSGQILAAVDVGGDRRLCITLNAEKGRAYVDVRINLVFQRDCPISTGSGFRVDLDQLPALREVLTNAERQVRHLGLIERKQR